MPDIQDQLQAGLVDRYMLEREIGGGGMATVYLARDLKHDRPVALKLLDPEPAATVGSERFLREIKLAARLQHPHILSVHDSGEIAGFLWFTMPYVEGESLRVRLTREKQLPIEEAVMIACEAAEALDFAHRRGVVHRDIKPDNILLTEGHALVADFGVGRALGISGEDTITGSGMVVGTPGYMAPEQAMGQPIDGRSDLYSLGIVAHEMLVGAPPTAEVVLGMRFSGEPPRLRSMRPAVPEGVEQAVVKALAPAPADRFQTGAEFARALREALVTSAGRPSSRIPALAAGPRRNRARLMVVLGMGFLLGVGVLFAWRRSNFGAERAAPKRIAVLPFVNLNQAGDEYFADGITDDVRGKLAALPGMYIAGRVAQTLDIALAAEKREQLAERPTGDLAAYDLYLRGQHAFHRRTAAGLGEARELFEQAIARDPRFALAHAGLADVYVVLPFWMDVPPRQTYPRATAAAVQALSLDSTLGRAHAALADARALYEWDWTAAERGFKRALELDPSNANTHHWYGEDYLNVVGRGDDAVREGRRALELDPLSPIFGTTLAQTLLSIGRYDEALALADDILSLDTNYSLVQETRGRALLHSNRFEDAVQAFQRNLELSGRKAMALALLGYAYTRVNRRADAEQLLRELETTERTGYASGTAVAILHAGLGDTTEAFRWLETAAEQRDPFLLYFFVVDPVLEGLQKNPRGVALLKRMNLGARLRRQR